MRKSLGFALWCVWLGGFIMGVTVGIQFAIHFLNK
jgi:hypothetical protein